MEEQDALETIPPKKRSWRFWIVVVAVVLLAVGLLWLAQALVAKSAVDRMIKRYGSINSAAFSGQLKFSGEDFLAPFKSDLQFSGHYQRGSGGIAADTAFRGQYLNRQYDGQAVVDAGKLYFNLSGPDMPVIRFNQLTKLYQIVPAWHVNRLDKSIYDLYCENRPGSSGPQALELYRVVRMLKLKQTSPANPFARLKGDWATQIRGKVDPANLSEIFDRLNAALPAGCGFAQNPDDLQRLKIDYEFLIGSKADQLKLTIRDPGLGSTLELTLSAGDFDKPVTIIPPPSAIDLNKLR